LALLANRTNISAKAGEKYNQNHFTCVSPKRLRKKYELPVEKDSWGARSHIGKFYLILERIYIDK